MATSATTVTDGQETAGEPVALQYFDYHEPGGPEGDHWDRIAKEAELIAGSGYDAVWVQPPMEPVTEQSNGYNPSDHLTWDSPLGSEDAFERMVEELGEARHADRDLFVHEREGSLLAAINKADHERTEHVYTTWSDRELHDYTGSMDARQTGEEGWVELSVPANSWVCYAPY